MRYLPVVSLFSLNDINVILFGKSLIACGSSCSSLKVDFGNVRVFQVLQMMFQNHCTHSCQLIYSISAQCFNGSFL